MVEGEQGVRNGEDMREACGESRGMEFAASVERLAASADALEQAVSRFMQNAAVQHAEFGAKVDRIVAAVDESQAMRHQLEARIAELESANHELKQRSSELAARAGRKTLSPTMSALLAKSGVEAVNVDPATLDKTLAPLSVEQRVAVKAEMARAGIIG